MKHAATIVLAMCLMGLLSFSHAGATSNGPLATGSSMSGAMGKRNPPALKSDVVGPAPAVAPGPSTPSKSFRDIPPISRDYSVRGTTLMPYIGTGFGSGDVSDLDRSLNGGHFFQNGSGLRSLFGQGLTPSEFQMGIRIPF
jgi:hypothetical protein